MQFKDQKALGQEACISLTNQRRLLVLAERKEKVESWQLTEIEHRTRRRTHNLVT